MVRRSMRTTESASGSAPSGTTQPARRRSKRGRRGSGSQAQQRATLGASLPPSASPPSSLGMAKPRADGMGAGFAPPIRAMPHVLAQAQGVTHPVPRAGVLDVGVPRNVPQPMNLASLRPHERTAAMEYDAFVNELQFNSKDVINNLTKIAGENLASFNAIAFVLENRILNAPPHAKLPFLYLVDSICKNIGNVYIHRFRQGIYQSFVVAYDCATPTIRASMHRLLNTWPPIFGSEVVDAIAHHVASVDASTAGSAFPYGSSMPRTVGEPAGPAGMGTIRSAGPKASPANSVSVTPAKPDVRLPTTQNPAVAHVESLLAEVSRKAAAGTPPSPVDLNTISSMVNNQLRLVSLSQHDRERLRVVHNQVSALQTSVGHPQGIAFPIRDLMAAGQATQSCPSIASQPKALASHVPPSGSVPPVLLHSGASLAIPRSAPHAGANPAKVLSFSDLKRLSHTGAVRSLYTELTFLSKSDGMRFKTQMDLRSHLDWLFMQNKRKRARARMSGGSGVSRCWYSDVQAFVGNGSLSHVNRTTSSDTKEGDVLKTKSVSGGGHPSESADQLQAVSCEARGDEEVCPTCCEGFESSWDDNKQSWMLVGGVRPDPDGPAYHENCYVAPEESGANGESAEVEDVSTGFAENLGGLVKGAGSNKLLSNGAATVGISGRPSDESAGALGGGFKRAPDPTTELDVGTTETSEPLTKKPRTADTTQGI